MSLLENRLSENEPSNQEKKQHDPPHNSQSEVEKAVAKSKQRHKNEPIQEEPEHQTNGVLNARMHDEAIGRNSDPDNSYDDIDEFEPFENPDIPDEQGMTQEDADFLSQLEEEMSEEQHLKSEKHNKRMRLASQIAMTVACLYVIVLIFGALITEYHYGDSNTVEPVILSVSDIESKNEYSTLANLYLQARTIYERILVLDYRVAQNEEDLMNIAPEYEEELDNISTLATSIEAADLLSKYNQVSSMLLEWVQTHIAAYCQYMSAAITQNDSNAADEAIAARSVVYTNFQLITENIISLGEEVEVYDLTDIKAWSPEEYVAEAVEGVD